jgi:hypothetical protein
MYFRRKTSAGRAYLQIVESRRDGEAVRQQVIATLGRFEELQASGQLERLVRSGARFAAKAMVLSAAADEAAIKIAVRRIGPALLFERLWKETGCRAVITELSGKRKHGSPRPNARALCARRSDSSAASLCSSSTRSVTSRSFPAAGICSSSSSMPATSAAP